VTRRMLLLLAAWGLGDARLDIGPGRTSAASSALGSEQALVALFPDAAQAHAMGQAYLAGLADMPSTAALAHCIWEHLEGSGPIRSRVQDLVRRDFAEGRIVWVDGWILAVNEARLCALAALSGQRLRAETSPLV
jgi:hypothetical protein